MEAELNVDERAALRAAIEILRQQRWASLATAVDDQPLASMVGYCLHPEFDGVLLHLSNLARHTQNLHANPWASLAVSEHDDQRRDPQTLLRISIDGPVNQLESGAQGYAAARRAYLNRFPGAADRFAFADFALYHLSLKRIHCVLGFGRILALSGKQFRMLLPGDEAHP
jgi:putative heme iron utilization protein